MKTLIKLRMKKYTSTFLFLSFIIIISILLHVNYISYVLYYIEYHSTIKNNVTKYNYSLFGENNYTKINFKKSFIISNGDNEYSKYIKIK